MPSFIQKNWVTAVALQPIGTFNEQNIGPPFSHGLEALAAVVKDEDFVLEIVAKFPLIRSGNPAGAAAVAAIEKRVAAEVEESSLAGEAAAAQREYDSISRRVDAAKVAADQAKRAYLAGIRLAPNAQLRANMEFARAVLDDLLEPATQASERLRIAKIALREFEETSRRAATAEALDKLADRRRELIAKTEAFVRSLAAEMFALADAEKAIKAPTEFRYERPKPRREVSTPERGPGVYDVADTPTIGPVSIPGTAAAETPPTPPPPAFREGQRPGVYGPPRRLGDGDNA